MLKTTYVYTGVVGDSFQVIAVSDDHDLLRARLMEDVAKYIDENYFEDDLLDLDLVPVDQIDDFWCDYYASDHDGNYVEFHIFEAPVI